MNARPRRIAAIGGGGFLIDEESLRPERWLLSRTGTDRPSVRFLGTAGGDAERGQLKFHRAFSRLDCRLDCLPFFPTDMKRDYRQAVLGADLVYVGGGVRPGLGWLPGTFCPYLDSAAWRQPVLAAQAAAAVGAGEGVVVLYDDGAWAEAERSASGTPMLRRVDAEGSAPLALEPRALV